MTLTAFAIGFGVTIFTQIIKKWIKPKLGDEGVLGFVILVSFAVASVQFIIQNFVPKEYLEVFLVIATSAVAYYEFLIKRLVK